MYRVAGRLRRKINFVFPQDIFLRDGNFSNDPSTSKKTRDDENGEEVPVKCYN